MVVTPRQCVACIEPFGTSLRGALQLASSSHAFPATATLSHRNALPHQQVVLAGTAVAVIAAVPVAVLADTCGIGTTVATMPLCAIATAGGW